MSVYVKTSDGVASIGTTQQRKLVVNSNTNTLECFNDNIIIHSRTIKISNIPKGDSSWNTGISGSSSAKYYWVDMANSFVIHEDITTFCYPIIYINPNISSDALGFMIKDNGATLVLRTASSGWAGYLAVVTIKWIDRTF